MALNNMICDTLEPTGRYVFIVGLRPKVQSFLEKQCVLEKVDKGHIYTDRYAAS